MAGTDQREAQASRFYFGYFPSGLPPKRKGGAILKELILDIDFMMKYAPLFAKAAWTTLGIGAAGIFLSFLAGLVISVIRYRKIPFLLPLSTAYVELSRNTPLLVQLFSSTSAFRRQASIFPVKPAPP